MSTPKLNLVNYLNVAGYLLNTLGTYVISYGQDLPDNGEVSERYQTLITPAGWAFAIWGIIFLAQAIFVFVQLLPDYRSKPLVQDGVGYCYFATCFWQTAWSPAFSNEKLVLSAVIMTFIYFSLIFLVISQHKIPPPSDDDDASSFWSEYWMLRFPFEIHCGWIAAAFVVNANAAAVAEGASSRAQFSLAVVSIVYVVFVAGLVLLLNRPKYTIAVVLAWATFGISMELRDPKTLIVETFSASRIETIRVVAASVCAVLLLSAVIRYAYGRIISRPTRGSSDTGNENALLSQNQQGMYS